MSSISRRLVYEEYSNENRIPIKIEIYKKDKKQNIFSGNWKGVLLILALILLIAVFISSLFVLKWKRSGLFLEDCHYRSCASGFGLKCINSICKCPTVDFYYTNKCLPKKSYGEFCHNHQEQCKEGLVCYNGKCSCNQTQFWTGKECSNRASYTENCEFKECLDSLYLMCESPIKLCTCGSTRFWSGEACYRKRLYNEFCGSVLNACRSELGLICLNELCSCNDTITFYNSSSLTCLPKKTYLETCSGSNECSELQGLYCSPSGNCDCLNSTISYFDKSNLSCISKKNELESCSVNIPCLGDMICSNNSCKCSNTTTHYFSSTKLKCLSKTLKGVSCIKNTTCRSDLGLSCVNGSCQCDSQTSYWSSVRTSCVQCPSGWTIFQDKCYFVFNNRSTWDAAQSTCESSLGNLVSIRTQADFDMVSGFYLQYTNYQELWVGARQNITYDFYWRDGFTKMNQTYPNASWWCPSQPNNNPSNSPVGVTIIYQDCVRMQKWPGNCDNSSIMCSLDVCLNDWASTSVHAFLCERE